LTKRGENGIIELKGPQVELHKSYAEAAKAWDVPLSTLKLSQGIPRMKKSGMDGSV